MPTTLPGLPTREAGWIVQQMDKKLKQIPEVEHVFAKLGRADTSTDPAPVSMIETIVLLKPKSGWRPGITKDKIVEDLNQKLSMPGVALGWTQPIINRINMLTTGVRTDLGLKFFGNNLDTLEQLAVQAEALLKPIQGAADVAAERVQGGSFLDIRMKPEAAALYGVTPADLNRLIETAIGGADAGTVVDGRARYPITIRYEQSSSSSIVELQSLLVPIAIPVRSASAIGATSISGNSQPAMSGGAAASDDGMGGMGDAPDNTSTSTPMAASTGIVTPPSQQSLFTPTRQTPVRFVRLGDIATIRFVNGPPMISSENALLRSIVYLNVRGRDMGGFVGDAKRALAARLKIPAGYTLQWSGQYEQQQHAADQLQIMVPLVFVIIFLLLYFTLRDWKEASTVMLSVPFALIGGVYLIALLGYNWSVAVWVGFIALYGVATETGVVMVVYLHEALDRKLHSGQPITLHDIYQATVDGAVLRLRPKLMTVATAMIGLVPILFSTGVGSDVMKPIAAPMIGGMLTSAVHVLVVTPIIFYLMKRRAFERGTLRASTMAGWMQH
jgi:Cu(I)/Ag(I) efflux system membrane protein CusA/SilA